MAESFVQAPVDSTGKMLRARSRVIGANTVYEQGVMVAAMDTWTAIADAVVPANPKNHISIFNGSGSGKIIKVRKLYCINIATGTTAGVLIRVDLRRTTAQSAGTTLTPVAHDTNNAAIPAQVLIATGATTTNGAIIIPTIILTEEYLATQPLQSSMFAQFQNIVLEGMEVQELTLREGQGVTASQTTAGAAGSLAWVMTFTIE